MNLFKPPAPKQAEGHFNQYFHKLVRKNPSRPLQVRVFSHTLGLDYSFPFDSTSKPFHTASIGKVFTAVLVHRLAEKGLLRVSDRIMGYLTPEMLERLFVYQSVDYAAQVTVEHLLGHTSGVADYFEGRVTGGKSFMDEVLQNHQTHWTPQMLLDFSRNQQTAVGSPGMIF